MLDLGRHRLKDIPEPVHLFQLVADGLDRDFPPVRSLGGLTRLPAAGGDDRRPRRGARRAAAALLADEATPAGDADRARRLRQDPPGARARPSRWAARSPTGVYFVPLEAVTTADVMWTAIAERSA